MHRFIGLAVVLAFVLPVSSGIAGESGRQTLEERLDALDGEDATAAFRLALELAAAGADDLATKAYEIVVGIDPDHRAARRALGYEHHEGRWLKGDDLFRAKGFVHHQDRWMTSEEFADATRPQRRAAEQQAGEKRVWALLAEIATEDEDLVRSARRKLAGVEARFKLAPLAQALRVKPASLRRYAAEELGRLGNPLAVPALLKAAVHDPDDDVRDAIGGALGEIGSPDAVAPLSRALDSRYAEVRVRAAEVLSALEDNAAIGAVVYKWVGRSGDFPRVYFSQVNQVSYIQDFDVEVAQTSFIADPIVGVIQDGLVHAVKIHATEYTFTTVEEPAYHQSLVKMTGIDLGKNPRRWLAFWKQNEERLMDERAEKYKARRSERE